MTIDMNASRGRIRSECIAYIPILSSECNTNAIVTIQKRAIDGFSNT